MQCEFIERVCIIPILADERGNSQEFSFVPLWHRGSVPEQSFWCKGLKIQGGSKAHPGEPAPLQGPSSALEKTDLEQNIALSSYCFCSSSAPHLRSVA